MSLVMNRSCRGFLASRGWLVCLFMVYVLMSDGSMSLSGCVCSLHYKILHFTTICFLITVTRNYPDSLMVGHIGIHDYSWGSVIFPVRDVWQVTDYYSADYAVARLHWLNDWGASLEIPALPVVYNYTL